MSLLHRIAVGSHSVFSRPNPLLPAHQVRLMAKVEEEEEIPAYQDVFREVSVLRNVRTVFGDLFSV